MEPMLRVPDPTAALRAVKALYDEGRYADALRAAPWSDLREWPGTHGRVLAGRLARRLGAPRLSQALRVRAYRDAPSDAEAAYFMADVIYARRGAWHCLEWLRARRDDFARTGDLVLLEARSLAVLRDFERAHLRLEEAGTLACDGAWIESERAFVAELEDRVPEAIAITEAALERWPAYRPLVAHRAALLASAGRPEDALAALDDARVAQSWELLHQRAELAHSLRRYDACERDLEAARAAALLLEPRVARFLASALAEAAYLCSAHRRAEAHARATKSPFGERFAEALAKLEDGAPPPRVELAGVVHIRQHHVTCMPASLAMVCAYHGDPADHVQIADDICYAGTPLHRAARWARERGHAVRQLDVDFDRARTLIDAGFPFVLSTARTAGAHSNVVIGYDLPRRSLLVRDPGTPSLVEIAEETLEAQAWHGPHGLVVASAARAAELDAIELGESPAWWEASLGVSAALDAHDVARARALLAELEARAPASQHLHVAACALARYEGRAKDHLAHLDALLALHPDTPAWILQRGEAMRGHAPVEERLAWWARVEHLDDAALLESLAEDLRHEVAGQARARRLLRRALRLAPDSAMAHHVLADLRASRGEDDLGVLESYRFGACLALGHEHFLQAYFEHARACGRDEEALALVRRCAEEAEDRATGPARVLFELHLDAGNPERGVEVLEELAARRPHDGDLALLLVRAHTSAGSPDRAAEWLARAGERAAHEGNRLLAAAQVARARGDLGAAREALESALAREPWRVDALGPLADVLLELEGRDAATARVEAAYATAPEDGAILGELIAWLGGRDDARALALVEARVAAWPSDHWARRELAIRLAAVGRIEEGLEVAREAAARTPFESVAFGVLGDLCARTGDVVGARAALRRAVELSIDNGWAIQRLSGLGADPGDTRDDVRFVLDQLRRRVSRGTGIIEAAHASIVLPHEERRARLDELLAMASHRPDAWEAVIRARLEAGATDEAGELSSRAIERFPRWFPLRRLEAEVHRMRGDPEAEERALAALIALSPTWTEPRVRLAVRLRARGAIGEARALVEDGLRRAPRDAALLGQLAQLRFAEGDEAGAFETLFAALADDALDEDGFDRLLGWGERLGRSAAIEARLRARIAEAGRASLPWLRLALTIHGPERVDERAEALREALRRAPRLSRAADLLAVILADAGRFDDALAACPPPEWRGPVPYTIAGRRAWVLERSGRLEDAIAAMRAILEDAPDYAWGRRMLCDWLDRAGRPAEFLAEAEHLVREDPTTAIHFVYRADARRLTGDGAGAREDYARSLALDPSNGYAAAELVESHLAAGDPDAAEEVLERARSVLSTADALAASTRIDAARGRWDDALGGLLELTRERAPQPRLEAALRAFAGGPHLEPALALVEARFTDPDEDPDSPLAYAWARICEEAELDRSGRLLARRDTLGPRGHLALAAALEQLGEARRGWTLAWLWLRHGRWMGRIDALWGAFGYALHALGWMRACAFWMRDHAVRAGVRPWMLRNLVSAAWWHGRRQLAERAVAQALALPRDYTTDRHRVWELLHRGLAGEPIDSDLDALQVGGSEQGILHLVRALRAGAGARDLDDDAYTALLIEPLAAAQELERTDGVLFEPIQAALDHLTRERPHLRGHLRT